MSQTTEVETMAQEQTGAAGDQLGAAPWQGWPPANSEDPPLKTMRPKQWTKNVFALGCADLRR